MKMQKGRKEATRTECTSFPLPPPLFENPCCCFPTGCFSVWNCRTLSPCRLSEGARPCASTAEKRMAWTRHLFPSRASIVHVYSRSSFGNQVQRCAVPRSIVGPEPRSLVSSNTEERRLSRSGTPSLGTRPLQNKRKENVRLSSSVTLGANSEAASWGAVVSPVIYRATADATPLDVAESCTRRGGHLIQLAPFSGLLVSIVSPGSSADQQVCCALLAHLNAEISDHVVVVDPAPDKTAVKKLAGATNFRVIASEC